MKLYEIERKPVIRRFWTDENKAIEAARLLFRTIDKKEPVFVFATRFGIFLTKQKQYVVQKLSEGVRTDSEAIVFSTEINELEQYNESLKKAS